MLSKFLAKHPTKSYLLKKLVTVLEISQTLAIFVLLETECSDLDGAYDFMYTRGLESGMMNHPYVGKQDVRRLSMSVR